MSMAGQSPWASGVNPDDPEAIEQHFRDSRRLGNMGIALVILPAIISGVIGILGLIFGVIGVRKPVKHGQAVVGIVMSSIPLLFMGIIVLLIGWFA